jgi:hypothetical protein
MRRRGKVELDGEVRDAFKDVVGTFLNQDTSLKALGTDGKTKSTLILQEIKCVGVD